MKNAKLLMMGGLTAVGVALAVMDYNKDNANKLEKIEKAKLFGMAEDQVSQIELGSESSDILMTKSPEGWKIEKPFSETADSTSVEQYLGNLMTETAQEVTTKDKIDWALFGLTKPKATISLQTNSGQKIKLDISGKKNFEGSTYVRVQGQEKVLIGGNGWDNKMEKNVFDFRIRKLIRAPGGDMESIQFQSKTGNFNLNNKQGDWVWQAQPDWKLDQTAIRDVLGVLTGSSIVAYVKEELPPDKELSLFGLDKPAFNLKVSLKDSKTWALKMSALKDASFFVSLSDPAKIVKISQLDGEKLLGFNPEKLRDLSSPFNFQSAEVKKVDLTYTDKLSDKILSFENSNNIWTGKKGQKAIDSSKVAQMVDGFAKLKAEEFLATAKDDLKNNIQMKNDKGELLVELRWGEVQKKKVSGVEKNLVKASSSLTREPLLIEETQLKNLIKLVSDSEPVKKETEVEKQSQ